MKYKDFLKSKQIMSAASRIAYSTDTPAAEVPFIGLLEERV